MNFQPPHAYVHSSSSNNMPTPSLFQPNISPPNHANAPSNGLIPKMIDGKVQWFMYAPPQNPSPAPVHQPTVRELQLEKQYNQLLERYELSQKLLRMTEEEYISECDKLLKEIEQLNESNKKLLAEKSELEQFKTGSLGFMKDVSVQNAQLRDSLKEKEIYEAELHAKNNKMSEEIHQLKADRDRDESIITQLSNENEQLRQEKDELQKTLHHLKESKNSKLVQVADPLLLFQEQQQYDSASKVVMPPSSAYSPASNYISAYIASVPRNHLNYDDDQCELATNDTIALPPLYASNDLPFHLPQTVLPSSPSVAPESNEVVYCNDNEHDPIMPVIKNSQCVSQNMPHFSSSLQRGGGWLPKSQSTSTPAKNFFCKSRQFFRQIMNKRSRWKFNNGFSKTFEIPQSSFQPRQLVQVPRGSNLSKQHTDAVIFHHVFKPAVKAVVEKYHGTNSRRHPPSSCGRSVRNFCNEFPVFPFSHENVPAKSPRAKKRSSNPYISSPHPYQKSVSKSVPLPVTSLAAAAERHPTRTQIGNNLPVIPETSQLNPIQPISPAYQNTFPLATQPSPLPPLPPPYQRNEINPQQGPIPLTSSSYNPFLSQRQSIVPTNTNYLNERQWNQQQNSIVPHVSFVPSSPSPFIPEINAERKTQSLPPLQSSSNYYSNNKNEKSAAASFIPEMTQPQNTNSVTNDEKNINENNFTKKLPVHSSTEPVRIYATQQINKSEALGNVYLEIQEGDGPRANTVNNPVKIGDKITLVIRSDDVPKDENQYNLFVHSCYASDGPGTTRIELIDKAGCGVSSQIIGQMQRERDQKTIIYFFKLTAFKFPGPDDVYFSCLVDISHNYNFPELCEKNNNITNKRFLSKRELITDNIDSIPLFNDIKVNLDNDGNEKPTQNEDHQSLKDAAETSSNNHFCLSLFSTVFLSSIIIVLTLGLIFFFVTSLILFLRLRKQRNK